MNFWRESRRPGRQEFGNANTKTNAVSDDFIVQQNVSDERFSPLSDTAIDLVEATTKVVGFVAPVIHPFIAACPKWPHLFIVCTMCCFLANNNVITFWSFALGTNVQTEKFTSEV